MIIEDLDLDERINNPDNLTNRLQIHKIERGAPKGIVHVPDEIKKAIAIIGNETDETQQSIADTFGLSRQTVNGYENARDRDTIAPNESLVDVVKESRAKVEGKRLEAESSAIETVLKVLNIIPDEVEDAKVDKKALKRLKAFTGVARDLSTVANQVSKRGNGEFGDESAKQVIVHLYRPEQAKLSDYEVVEGTVVK